MTFRFAFGHAHEAYYVDRHRQETENAPSAHPGWILRDLYLEPLGVRITQAAQVLGVTLIIVLLINVASRRWCLR